MVINDFFRKILKLCLENRPADRTVKTIPLSCPLAHYLTLKNQRFSTWEIEYMTIFTKYFGTENISTNLSITITITKSEFFLVFILTSRLGPILRTGSIVSGLTDSFTCFYIFCWCYPIYLGDAVFLGSSTHSADDSWICIKSISGMIIEMNEWSCTSSPYVPSGFGQTKFWYFNVYERDLIHFGRVINASESRLTLKECYRYFSHV